MSTTTGLDAATLARSLRRMAGDGSVEWVMEPIQASVLLDVADMLDENAKLRERVAELEGLTDGRRYVPQEWYALVQSENAKLRKLVQDWYPHMRRRVSVDALGQWGHMQTLRELGLVVE